MSSWKTKEIINGVQENNNLSKNKIYLQSYFVTFKVKTKNEGLKWLLNIQNNISNDARFVTNFQCKNLVCNNLNSSLTLEGS